MGCRRPGPHGRTGASPWRYIVCRAARVSACARRGSGTQIHADDRRRSGTHSRRGRDARTFVSKNISSGGYWQICRAGQLSRIGLHSFVYADPKSLYAAIRFFGAQDSKAQVCRSNPCSKPKHSRVCCVHRCRAAVPLPVMATFCSHASAGDSRVTLRPATMSTLHLPVVVHSRDEMHSPPVRRNQTKPIKNAHGLGRRKSAPRDGFESV